MAGARVVLTGAAGKAAALLRPLLAQRGYRLRLVDRVAIADAAQNEETVQADLEDLGGMCAALRGARAVVHLGGVSQEADFEAIARANLRGTYHLLEAARLERVERVVIASTGHVNGCYRRDVRLDAASPVRPDTLYAASKVFAEVAAREYARAFGLRVLCIRIGHVVERPEEQPDASIWISPRDLAQLVDIGLTRDGLRYEIVYGISNNSDAWWENGAARALGYAPADGADAYSPAADTAARPRRVADVLQGGGFAAAGFQGTLEALR
jgi:uronate dehydrogenase